MMPLDNKHVENLEDPLGLPFSEKLVEQVEQAKDSVFSEICQELNVSDNQNIRSCYLNKRSVTKEKLSEWLETVCYILDSFSVPLLQSAVPLVERIGQLREEKIADQKSIIELQNKVIEKHEDEIKSVQTTVKAEMSSYSSMVTKSCTAALAPKRIQAAVKKATDRQDRSRNVIVYGLAEPKDVEEQLQGRVEEVLSDMGEKPLIRECCRVGIKRVGATRPVKFSLSSSDHVAQVLRNARQLRTKEGYRSIYICPDRSVDERRAYKKLVEELYQKRRSEPDNVHYIKNNKVVSSTRDSKPVQPG